MKPPIFSALLLTTALAVAGCAGMDHRSNVAAPKRVSPATEPDAAYMAHVESIARGRGTKILWISPPVRRTNSSEDPQ